MAKRKLGIKREALRDLCQFFSLLSDETRLGLCLLLVEGGENVGALCGKLGLAQPTVSHHLGLLRRGRVVNAERRGKQVVYTLNVRTLEGAGKSLLKGIPGGGAVKLGGVLNVKSGRG